ncbi:MAG: hypothetical protein OHK0052_17820 [Anaerolineales bacterium]
MTDQILDTLIYYNRECPLLAICGDGLLTPRDFSINPTMLHTGCLRGYYMRYSCQDGQLFLDQMTVRAVDGRYSKIGNLEPFQSFGEMWTAMTYAKLCEPVPYTGGIVIGRDFQREVKPIHPHKYFSYKSVTELLFENGKLQKEINYSEKFTENLRESGHIRDIFSLDYDFFYTITLSMYQK